MDANSLSEDEYDSSTTAAMNSPASAPSISMPAFDNISPKSSPTAFDLPIRSFLEAYQHPAFVLEAQSLFESLVQRLSIWRTSDPEEPGNVESNMAHGIQREDSTHSGRDRQGGGGDLDAGAGGSGRGSERGTVSSGSPGMRLANPLSDASPSEITVKSAPRVGVATTSTESVESATVLPNLPHRHSGPPNILNAHDANVSNILSEAFAPQQVPEEEPALGAPPTLHTASDVVMDSLSELPTSGRTSYYPYITGKAADVGWNHTLRSLLTPVWANAAWYNLLHAMNISTLLGPEDGLLELLSRSDIQALVSFLRRVVATAGGVPPDPDEPSVLSVQLELVSHSADHDYQPLPIGRSPSSGTDDPPSSRATTGGAAQLRVQIELVATMIDSTTVTTAPPGHHPLNGQYLVITSIASSVPIVLDEPTSFPSSPSTSQPDASQARGTPLLEEKEHSPALPAVSSPTTSLMVPSGFILESQRKPKRRRPGALSRHRLSQRSAGLSDSIPSEEEDNPRETSVRTTDSNMMEWADPNASGQLVRPMPTPKSQWIPQEMLDSDPFCKFLTTLYMGCLILAFPWHTTPLGPLLEWSGDLKSLISLMLASPFRESLWVGKEAVML